MKRFYQFFGLILTLFLIAGCNKEPQGKFIVKGRIDNAYGKKLLLEELPFGSNTPIVLDSCTIRIDGTFSMKGIAREQELFAIVIDQGPQLLIINDSRVISIQMDLKQFKKYTIKGSEASEQLHAFLDQYEERYTKLYSEYSALDTLSQSKTKQADSILTWKTREKELSIRAINDYLTESIAECQSPALAYYILAKSFHTMTLEQIDKNCKTALAKFPDHSGLKKLASIIAMQVATDPRLSLLNKNAPDIYLPDTSRRFPFGTRTLKGKYALIDFWASWCTPCRIANPLLLKIYRAYNAKGFDILGVSLDTSKTDWTEAIIRDSLPWKQVSDLRGWQSPLLKSYMIKGIPFNVLLDPNGKIIGVDLSSEELNLKLNKLLH